MKRTPADPPPSDEDSAWKEIVDRYLRHLIALFFPALHAAIDWDRGYDSLDKELQKIAPRGALGRRYVDKLVRVWMKSGESRWLLIHLEIQGYVDAGFPRRMYVYGYRLFDRYGEHVVSLAVLTDDDPSWRPREYQHEEFGYETRVRFPMVKLLDWEGRPELEGSGNPFGVVVRAQLAASATRQDMGRRLVGKVELTKELYRAGYERQETREVLRFIDWLMTLPEAIEETYREEIERFEKEEEMAYIPSYERRAHEEGLQDGLQKGLQDGLQKGLQDGIQEGLLRASREAVIDNLTERFGAAPVPVIEAIRRIDAIDRLVELRRLALRVPSAEEFGRRLLPGS